MCRAHRCPGLRPAWKWVLKGRARRVSPPLLCRGEDCVRGEGRAHLSTEQLQGASTGLREQGGPGGHGGSLSSARLCVYWFGFPAPVPTSYKHRTSSWQSTSATCVAWGLPVKVSCQL